MMRMKEGHTEMETISPTGTGNEGIKVVFKQWHQAQFFSNTPFGDLKTLSGGQEKKIYSTKLCGILMTYLIFDHTAVFGVGRRVVFFVKSLSQFEYRP